MLGRVHHFLFCELHKRDHNSYLCNQRVTPMLIHIVLFQDKKSIVSDQNYRNPQYLILDACILRLFESTKYMFLRKVLRSVLYDFRNNQQEHQSNERLCFRCTFVAFE